MSPIPHPTRVGSIVSGAKCAALMVGLFALLMIIGFPLRHGYPIWEAF